MFAAIDNPRAPSTIFAELQREQAAANAKVREALEAFEAQSKKNGTTSFLGMNMADAFYRTPQGKELYEAQAVALRRVRDVQHVSQSVWIAGKRYDLADVRVEARESVYRAAAEHGFDSEQWPRKVRDDVCKVLTSAPRAPTYREAAEQRRKKLIRDSGIERILEAHGLDPTKWPDDALDEVARLKRRADALDSLIERASSVDVNWSQRSTEVQS